MSEVEVSDASNIAILISRGSAFSGAYVLTPAEVLILRYARTLELSWVASKGNEQLSFQNKDQEKRRKNKKRLFSQRERSSNLYILDSLTPTRSILSGGGSAALPSSFNPSPAHERRRWSCSIKNAISLNQHYESL